MLPRLDHNGMPVYSFLLQFHGKRFDHGRNDRLGHFHVKQKAVGVSPVAEGLAAGQRGGSERRGACREVEDVAMPVVGQERGFDALPKRIALRGRQSD